MKKYLFLSLMLTQFLYSNFETISKTSLLHYKKKIYSQFGEDGIIEEIFRRIGVEKGFFVEFGAMDGKTLSNTYALHKMNGWEGLYIESQEKYIEQLAQRFPNGCGVQYLVEFIKWNKKHKGKYIDEILNEHFPEKEIDFMSIDIDGGDYFIFKKLKVRPKVICIECGMGYHPLFNKPVSQRVVNKHPSIGQPMGAFIKKAYEKGYVPIVYNVINLFLVREDLAYIFNDIIKEPVVLFRDSFRTLSSSDKKTYFSIRSTFQRRLEDKDYDSILKITQDF